MADVKTWKYNPAGTITVVYNDGHTQIMSQQEAISAGVIKDPGTATSQGANVPAPVKPGQYGATSGTAVADPFNPSATAGSNFTVPVNGQQVPIAQLLQKANDPKVLAQIGSALRNYGIIPKGTKSQQSIINAYTSVLVKAASVSMDPNEWMSQFKTAGGGTDVTVATPSTNISTRTYTPDAIRSIADQIFVSKLGRNVTDADLKQLTAQLNAKEKAQPTVTKIVPKGTGTVTQTTTSGGIDEQGVITQQAQQMPEYQRMQNLNFAGWLSKAMQSGSAAAGGLANG
jgi:hypothetical protein